MGANTKIEWTATRHADGTVTPGHTFNLVWGCLKVSPGCANCYAETLAKRYGHNVWGPAKTTERRTMSDNYWRQPLRWNKAATQAGERQRVFCSSMADVFEDHPANERERPRLWELIEQTPMLDWLLLTKRPQNIRAMVPPTWLTMPRQNVWYGTSVEDQQRADERIPELLKVPARVRFLSCEPLLGPVDLDRYLWAYSEYGDRTRAPAGGWDQPQPIGWVICGGESGPGARPMHPQWARSLRDQCQAAGVAYHFKQWGEYGPWPDGVPFNPKAQSFQWHRSEYNGEHWEPRYEPHYRIGKHAAGRELDGRTWDELPA